MGKEKFVLLQTEPFAVKWGIFSPEFSALFRVSERLALGGFFEFKEYTRHNRRQALITNGQASRILNSIGLGTRLDYYLSGPTLRNSWFFPIFLHFVGTTQHLFQFIRFTGEVRLVTSGFLIMESILDYLLESRYLRL
jgi:hypothetical protein